MSYEKSMTQFMYICIQYIDYRLREVKRLKHSSTADLLPFVRFTQRYHSTSMQWWRLCYMSSSRMAAIAMGNMVLLRLRYLMITERAHETVSFAVIVSSHITLLQLTSWHNGVRDPHRVTEDGGMEQVARTQAGDREGTRQGR